jgi:hypothetical protein
MEHAIQGLLLIMTMQSVAVIYGIKTMLAVRKKFNNKIPFWTLVSYNLLLTVCFYIIFIMGLTFAKGYQTLEVYAYFILGANLLGWLSYSFSDYEARDYYMYDRMPWFVKGLLMGVAGTGAMFMAAIAYPLLVIFFSIWFFWGRHIDRSKELFRKIYRYVLHNGKLIEEKGMIQFYEWNGLRIKFTEHVFDNKGDIGYLENLMDHKRMVLDKFGYVEYDQTEKSVPPKYLAEIAKRIPTKD